MNNEYYYSNKILFTRTIILRYSYISYLQVFYKINYKHLTILIFLQITLIIGNII